MSDKTREEFEAKYALPAGLYWCEQGNQYVGHPQFWLFTDRLEVWIASRAAIEVTLPDYTSPFYGGDHFDECQYAADCEKAIEVLGLKVKP